MRAGIVNARAGSRFHARFRAGTRNRRVIAYADDSRPAVPVTRQHGEMLASSVSQRVTAAAQSADEARIRAGVVADRELRRRSTCYTDL